MDGDNKVFYDISGVNPIYYKGQYALYSIIDNKLVKQSNITWSIDFDDNINATKFYPQIDATTGQLVVPSMFMSGNSPRVSIIAKDSNNNIVWCQPLYIYQEVYSSVMMNAWDGSLTIDSDNNTIMSAMIGAGYKDSNNAFNGVLMGRVGNKTGVAINDKISVSGIFGYNAGAQTFGFTTDGTAFLGKSGYGQILFDGNKGIIKSSTWNTVGTNGKKRKGMYIDLDDAYIDFHGDETNNGQAKVHIGVNGGSSDTSYFNIIDQYGQTLFMAKSGQTNTSTDSYYLQSSGYSESLDNRNGVKFDLRNGKLTGYKFVLKALDTNNAGVVISSGIDENNSSQSYIKVTEYYNNSNKTLLDIQPNGGSFYFQSPDYVYGQSGTRIDIKDGKIISSNFYLYATNINTSGASRYIKIDSNASNYPFEIYQPTSQARTFRVKWDGSIEALSLKIGSMYMDNEGLFFNGEPGTGGQTSYSSLALWRTGTYRITLGTISFQSSTTTDTWTSMDANGVTHTYHYDYTSTDGITSGTSGFYVTSGGKIEATRGDFGTIYVGALYIQSGLNYKGQAYGKYQTGVVTGVSASAGGGSFTTYTYSLDTDTTYLHFLTGLNYSTNAVNCVSSITTSSGSEYVLESASLSSSAHTITIPGTSVSVRGTTITYLGRGD